MTNGPLNRRAFLTGSLGVCGLMLTSLGLANGAAAATPVRALKAQAAGVTRQKDGSVVVDTKRARALNRVGGALMLGTVKGVPAALVRTGSNAYTALDLRCTHAGVTVRQQGKEWRCPAHGSVFQENGAFVAGPAGAPLLRLKTSRKGNQITVG